ncbi:CBS domain-containing protein [Ferruginibacter paludis]|uniref:CBS domain-containing protein n=1 Tax=Ferruginibacter paludis TaxID=1310417 RepID=UPI0025B4D06F|nr:CBS domain-containing protein [Ferruginibacter paludis]MDN3659272.1 CBS domain-containing protein [Ferruginibacter paludis]
MRTVANILMSKTPAFNFVDPDAKVIEALHIMNSVNLSYLVVYKNDTFYGIFSERDYSRNVILKGLHSDSCAVKEVMSVSLPVIDMQDTAEHCMELLNTHKTRYLIVFEHNQFKGVVTINDVLREALKSKEMVFDELTLNQAMEWQDKIF